MRNLIAGAAILTLGVWYVVHEGVPALPKAGFGGPAGGSGNIPGYASAPKAPTGAAASGAGAILR